MMSSRHAHDRPRTRANPWALSAAAVYGLLTPTYMAVTLAQDTARALVPPGPLTLAEQIDLPRLVDIAAQRLKVNIEYDPMLLKGTVTLRLGAGVTDQELWDLMNRLLAARGFTTVSPPGRDKVLSVVKIESAANLARVRGAAAPGDSGPGEPGFSSVVYRLQYRSAKQTEEAMKSLLSKPGGSVTVLSDDLILVTDLSPRVTQALEVLRGIDSPGERAELLMIPVANLSAAQLATLATQVLAKKDFAGAPATARGDIIAAADGKHVMVVAPASTHQFWKELVSTLDRREPVESRTYAPKYFELKEVQRLLQETLGADERIRVVADDLTGTLVVTATAGLHEQVDAFVRRLNDTPPEGRRPLRTFKIRNRPVADMLTLLQSLVNSGELSGEWAESGDNGASAAPGSGGQTAGDKRDTLAGSTQTAAAGSPSPNPSRDDASAVVADNSRRPPPPPDTPSRGTRSNGAQGTAEAAARRDRAQRTGAHANDAVVLTADEGTGLIIAMGPPRILTQLERLITQLDVRQPQVMVQALVVSLSDSQARDLGVELEGQINLSGDSLLRLASLFGLSTPGSQVGIRNSSGAGGTGLLLSPGEFAVVIRALETINHGRSVSIPQVLVNNNQQASFNSTLEQPYATILNGSGENPQTTFGGSSSAGTVVTAKPQIGQGDYLLLDYSVELSTFVGEAAADLPPPKQTNNVASSVTLPDGYTVAVGGLELASDSQKVDQIPLLSQIPVLGEAFKNRSNTTTRSRFFVFLRAEVMRHERFEDLRYFSELRTAEANIDDGWPTLEPRLIK